MNLVISPASFKLGSWSKNLTVDDGLVLKMTKMRLRKGQRSKKVDFYKRRIKRKKKRDV